MDDLFTSSNFWTRLISKSDPGDMGRLHTIGEIIITVYANDHLPPHFHAVHPDFEAQVEIDTLTILRGSLSPAARKPVLEWAAANIAKIKAEWNRINPRFPVM